MKKHLLTYLSVSVLLLGAVAPSVSALAVTPVSAAEQTSATALDPNNLADGTYTIDAPVMKTGTNTTSMAQTFIDKSAKLSVKNHQLQLTLHIKQGAGMIADVKTSSNNQPVTVSNDTGEAKDLTFNIASLTAVTNLSLTLKVGTGMPEKMDVQPAPATLKVVQLDQPAVSSSSAASSSNTADESSQVVQPGAASSSSATTSQPIIESSSTQSVAAASSSASKADSAATQPTVTESKESTTKQESTAKQESTPAGHDSASAVKPETTPEKTATTFDPTHLIDGTYAVPVSILKTNSDDQSLSAGYFGPTATVVVAGDTVKVTLHVIKNASMIAAFGLDGQAATISNKTSAAEDLTFTVNDSFKDAIVPATMTISIPGSNKGMDQQARVKFGQALYVAPATQPTESTGSTTTPELPLFDPTHLADGTYQVPVAIFKKNSTTASMATSYFAPTATVVVSGDAVKVTLHVIKNASLINTFNLGGQTATISHATNATADLTYTVDSQFKRTTVPAAMMITIPGLNKIMNQEADVKFGEALYVAPDTTGQSDTTSESSSSSVDSSSENEATDSSKNSSSSSVVSASSSSTTESKDNSKVTSSSAKDSSSTESSSNKPSTTTNDNQTADTTTNLPEFDPNKLTDGVYQTGVAILKDDGVTASHSANFFAKKAIVTVVNKKAKVTLHMTQNASMVAAFALSEQNATISNATKDSVDLTFDINDKFANAIVPASMTLAIPGMSAPMAETAKVKFGRALYVAPTATDNNTQPNDGATTKPTDNNAATADNNETTDNKRADSSATFDPAHLVNGTYEVPITLLKENSNDASVSASFFAPTATVKVTGKVVTVTLHLIKNAATVTAFSLDGQAATITNNDGTKADLTFTVNDSFDTTIIPAAMTISVPVMHLVMNQKARVKFGQALYADKQNNTGSVKANSNSALKTATTTVQSHSFGSANAALNLNDLHDGTYNLNVPIMKTGLTTASAAQQFISQNVQLVVSNNGRTLKVIFHVTNGLEYIKGMTLAGQSAQIIKHSATAADFIFPVTKATLAGVGQVHFSLATPAGNLEEDAVAVFNLNHQPLTNLLKNTNAGLAPVTGGHDLLDANKQIQYVPYKVLDETRSKLSTANNYYTHTAKVVKDASGYKVYLTVQAPTGYVKFQPLSVNYGGYSDLSQSNAGGNDVWTYAFHINSATGLDQPLPATISMTVPIAGISNQQFEIWLVFGKAQGGGTDYLAANTTAEGLPTSTIALVQAANSAVNANSLVLTAAKATQQPAKSATLNQAKKTPNNTKKVVAAALQADQQKTAKLKDYPFMAEIAGFGAVAVAIIGFAIFKRRQV